jgi:hypothetical protein
MNVNDKALLYDMSFALSRRFAFIEVPSPTDQVFDALIDDVADGDSASASLAKRLLVLRKIKDLGPALYLDLTRYISARRHLGAVEDGSMLYEAFYSFLLPQFEGIDAVAGETLFHSVATIVGPSRRTSLRTHLNDILGLQLREMPSADRDKDDETGGA